jgi:hypothetical protein
MAKRAISHTFPKFSMLEFAVPRTVVLARGISEAILRMNAGGGE